MIGRQEDSFFSLEHEIENAPFYDNRNTADISMASMGRDTSNTCRDVSLDNTRDGSSSRCRDTTVNTHNSILDLTKDEEEDDEDDDELNTSVLFDDLQIYSNDDDDDVPPPPPPATSPSSEDNDSSSTTRADSPSKWGKFSINSVTDSFVDSFCPAEMPSATSCSSRYTVGCTPSYPYSSSGGGGCIPEQRIQTSMDVWNLLGCNAAPGMEEKESIWSIRTSQVIQKSSSRRPARVHMKERLKRIQRLRMAGISGPSRHGVTITPQIERAQSMMDGKDPLAAHIGLGLDAIPLNKEEEDGYDSDPGVDTSFHSAHQSHVNTSKLDDYEDDIVEQDHQILETVQVRLKNCSFGFLFRSR